MSTPSEILKALEGKTIETVDLHETEDGEIYSFQILCTDGSRVDVSPTSFNYGGQHLRIED